MAEKETIISLLKLRKLEQYIDKVRVDDQNIYFFKNWTYVDEVLMNEQQVNIKMHVGDDAYPLDWRGSADPLVPENKAAYLDFQVRFQDVDRLKYTVVGGGDLVPERQIINLKSMNTAAYRMMIELDGRLAYYGVFQRTNNLPY